MKKILVFLGVMFSSVMYSQIKVIKKAGCDDVGVVKALLTPTMNMKKCSLENGNTQYVVQYKDISFQQIEEWKSFSFLDIDNAFDSLYNIIIDGFSNPPKEDVMIELPEGSVYLHFEKNMGVTSFQFFHFPFKNSKVMGKSPYLTKKQVNKLFGK